ncbi:hypothetical protein DAERI_060012 [Deinococcus aerius]|uniref:Uncharacterized protein n=2 Tax=Deinococcus aerius TaxID=200253 RepID=A0A2I9CV39_9DEIO|nr:hypothetical protein DAERI_060012 [Deinococcus aerius]
MRRRFAPWAAAFLVLTSPGGTALGGGAAPTYRAEVHPGEVRLLRGGQVVRSCPVPPGQQAYALVAADDWSWRPSRDGFQLRVYALTTGRLFAGHTQVGRVARMDHKGNALFVEYASATAEINTRTWVKSLRVAGEGGDIDGWRVAENDRSLLFNSPNGAYSPYEAVRLNYFRYDAATGRVTPPRFAVPARPGCGPVEKDGTQGEGETHTSSEVLVTRHDACGGFEAAFAWTAGFSDKPVVTPPT